jgi:hypothetical protein
MQANVFTLRQNLKIAQCVVLLVPVNVVHDFTTQKPPANLDLGKNAVSVPTFKLHVSNGPGMAIGRA